MLPLNSDNPRHNEIAKRKQCLDCGKKTTSDRCGHCAKLLIGKINREHRYSEVVQRTSCLIEKIRHGISFTKSGTKYELETELRKLEDEVADIANQIIIDILRKNKL